MSITSFSLSVTEYSNEARRSTVYSSTTIISIHTTDLSENLLKEVTGDELCCPRKDRYSIICECNIDYTLNRIINRLIPKATKTMMMEKSCLSIVQRFNNLLK